MTLPLEEIQELPEIDSAVHQDFVPPLLDNSGYVEQKFKPLK
jgi:hypothetical protein